MPSQEIVNELQNLFNKGQYWDVLKVAQEWLKKNESYDVRIEQLKALRHFTLVKDAHLLAEGLSGFGPINPIVESIRGWATYHRDDESLGKKILDTALLDYPWDGRLLYELSAIYVLEGRPQLAEEILRKAVEEQPGFFDLHLSLAAIHGAFNQHELVAESVQEARTIRGAKLVNSYALARFELANGNYEIGLEIAGELILAYPRAYQGYVLTAIALSGLNRHREALLWIRKAFRLVPNDIEVVEAWKGTRDHVNQYYQLWFLTQLVASFLVRSATHFGLRRITPYRPKAERQ